MAFVSPFQVCYFSLSLIAVCVFVGFTCIYAWFMDFDSCSHNFSLLLCPALSIYKRWIEKRCEAKSFAGRTLYPAVPLVENSQCLHFSFVFIVIYSGTRAVMAPLNVNCGPVLVGFHFMNHAQGCLVACLAYASFFSTPMFCLRVSCCFLADPSAFILSSCFLLCW